MKMESSIFINKMKLYIFFFIHNIEFQHILIEHKLL